MRGADGAKAEDGGPSGGGGGGGTITEILGSGISVLNPLGPVTTLTATAATVGADVVGSAAAGDAAHVAAPDPHPQYTTTAEAAAAAPVQSVNGNTGTVVLGAADVGADPAGSAAAAVAAHEAASDPHPQYTTTAEAAAAAPVQSVNTQTGTVSLGAGDVGADPAGTAAAGVAAHVALPDPHPQYTTTVEAAAAAPVQSVNSQTGTVSLGAGDVGADPAGTAAAAVAAHNAALDPHPQYTTVSEAAAAAPVQSVAGKTGTVSLVVADVSGAAPLASPTFTGDPKVPTPATTDNDTTIANTEFVNNAIDNFVEPARVIRLVDDFAAGTTSGSVGWSTAGNGAGNIIAPNTSVISGAKGHMVLNAGTNAATGRASLSFEATAGQLPFVQPWLDGLISVEFRVQLQAIPVLTTADYQPNVSLGAGATAAGVGFADGVGIFCNGSNANWIFASRTTSVTVTSVNTGVAVAASTWIYMRIEVDSVSARAYIGATKATAALVGTILIASVTTTVALGPMMKTFNIAGGVARDLRVDYVRLVYTLTTAR